MVITVTLLTPYGKILFDKMIDTQVSNKLAVFYTIQKFIIVLNCCIIHQVLLCNSTITTNNSTQYYMQTY